jgi:hypothetical protein
MAPLEVVDTILLNSNGSKLIHGLSKDQYIKIEEFFKSSSKNGLPVVQYPNVNKKNHGKFKYIT